WTQLRQHNAKVYDGALRDRLGSEEKLAAPVCSWKLTGDAHYHIYNQYVIRTKLRDRLRDFLTHSGVGTEIYYPLCLHLQKCFNYLGYTASRFPEAEKASQESLAIPVYPEIGNDKLQYVIRKITEFFDTESSAARGAEALHLDETRPADSVGRL